MRNALIVLALGYAAYRGYGFYQAQAHRASVTKVEIHEDITLGELKATLGEPDETHSAGDNTWILVWEYPGVQAFARGNDDASAPSQIEVGPNFKGEIRRLHIGQLCSTLLLPVVDYRGHGGGLNHAGPGPRRSGASLGADLDRG